MAIPIDDFIAGQMPGVKGLPFTPGEHGFAEEISTGRMHAAQSANVLGADVKTSFWWNLGPETGYDIHDIARASISYANAERLRLQNSPGNMSNRAAAEGMGITPEKLQNLVLNPKNRGSIAFTNLSKNTSSFYSGGGEEFGEAIQTSDRISKYIRMDLPESVYHTSSGPMIFDEHLKKQQALYTSDLKGVKFHDWMKEFAQNAKSIAPEGFILPKGTQELLDSPSTEQMVAAARARLAEVGQTEAFDDLKITSMKTFEHSEAGQVYKYSFLNNGVEEEKLFSASGLEPHIAEAKKNIPFSSKISTNVSTGSKIGETIDDSMPTSSKPFSQVSATMEKAEMQMSGKVGVQTFESATDTATQVSVKAGMAGRTLGGIIEAGETAAKVMRFRV
jgi:predicted DNA-binding protein (UPF0251 family)